MKIAVPDMLSNSYFPILAAVQLGYFKKEGIDATLELHSPTDRAFTALREGAVDIVGAEAHAALGIFPDWTGVKLLCAQAQGMYWFLVMRTDLGLRRNDLSGLAGRKIAAAPWVDLAFKRLLRASGIDPERDLHLAPLPELLGDGVNTGVTLAGALKDGRIDGFWANGMGAEMAVRSGAGTVVLDVRHGDGPDGCFDYTFSAVAATDDLIARSPDTAAAVVRAVVGAQEGLRRDVSLAGEVGRALFPSAQAELITTLIERDLPFYDASISRKTVDGLNDFATAVGLLRRKVDYHDVVAPSVMPYWRADASAS